MLFGKGKKREVYRSLPQMLWRDPNTRPFFSQGVKQVHAESTVLGVLEGDASGRGRYCNCFAYPAG